jgi:hypothetical protein
VIHTQKKDLVFFNTGLNTDLKKVEHTQKKASKLGRPPNLSLALEQEQVHQVKPKRSKNNFFVYYFPFFVCFSTYLTKNS